MQLGTFFTGFCISAAYHLKELWAKCLKTRVLTKKYVFKEKFKNIATYYFSDLSTYMIYELIARVLTKGENLKGLATLVVLAEKASGYCFTCMPDFGRKFKQKRGYSIVYD